MRRSAATNTADSLQAPERLRYHFIGGKGGTGKTTCAAALAIRASRLGRRTLVVTTDPAPSLADALDQPLGPTPRAVRGAPRLYAMELDARRAFVDWLASRRPALAEIALRGTLLDRDDVERLLSLSLPGIDEFAGLVRVGELGEAGAFDHVVVDAAPTGHLLRMLAMPELLERLVLVFDRMQAKHRAMAGALRGVYVADDADALILDMERQTRELAARLRDPRLTRISWITLPELLSVEETRDALEFLGREHIAAGWLVVNRLTVRAPDRCTWCAARRGAEAQAVWLLRHDPETSRLPLVTVPGVAREPRGVRALAGLGAAFDHRPRPLRPPAHLPPRRTAALDPLPACPAAPLVTPSTRLLLFGGKGGVGKTTCAAAAAIDLAFRHPQRGVLLLSTDPAHSIGDVLDQPSTDTARRVRQGPSNLAVRSLDAARAFARVREQFAAGVDALFRRSSAGTSVDATFDRQVMRSLLDLAPPGVDELAAIVDVVGYLDSERRTAEGEQYDLVVVDTAPTGHTLRLLEMPETLLEWTKALMAILLKYQSAGALGGIASGLLRLSRGLRALGALLHDPSQTVFATVTRPGALPRAETVRLLAALGRSAIPHPMVVVNAVGAGSCRRCVAERAMHAAEIDALVRALSSTGPRRPRLIVAPAELPPPRGARTLRAWRGRWHEPNRPSGGRAKGEGRRAKGARHKAEGEA